MRKLLSILSVFMLLSLPILALITCGTGGAAPASGARSLETQRVPVEGGGSYTDVNAAGLVTMLENENFPLINVHIPYEGEIQGTDLSIPYNEIGENLDKLPADKDTKLILYCRSGSMSATAACTLVKLGYIDVWNLDSEMIGWEQAGYPLQKNQ